MSDIKDILMKRANEAAHTSTIITSLAKVTKSDEANNVCDICYRDKNGRQRIRENVTVRIYGNGVEWFPKVNEVVIIEDTGDACAITSRYVGNYSMDIRSRRQLRQDIFSDIIGCSSIGNVIM